jgi:hypothetical protein
MNKQKNKKTTWKSLGRSLVIYREGETRGAEQTITLDGW